MVYSNTLTKYWALCMACLVLSAEASEPAVRRLAYPETFRSEQQDDYHGVLVADPYRWLEDVDGQETRGWIEAQNAVTSAFLDGIDQRDAIRQRLTELWNFERYSEPVQRGGRYFFTRNDGLQNQSVLYVAESLDGTPRELLDPNRLSEDGTVALAAWEPSDDGRLLAYGLAASGSDWREWHIRDVTTGEDLTDHLKWVKFSGVAWTPDHQGFFYSRYDEPLPGEKFTGANYYQKLFYHRVGDSQDQDRLVYERPDQKEWGFSGRVTDDGQYLIIHVWRGTEPENQVFYKPLADPKAEVVELLSGFDAEYQFLGNQGSLFWLLTDWDAPLRRVIAIDLERPERDQWKEVIAESADVIRGASIVGDRFFVSYLKHATTNIKMLHLTASSWATWHCHRSARRVDSADDNPIPRRSTGSPVSPRRRRSIGTMCPVGRVRCSAARNCRSIRRTTKRGRCFSRAETGRAYRCS
jgi:prolyl oligopeptidase